MTHDEQVAAIRLLADWYEAHPGASIPGSFTPNGRQFSALPDDATQRTAMLKAIGPFTKSVDDSGDFRAEVTVGPWTLCWFTSREKVCKARVVGKKHVDEQVIEGTPTRIISAHEEDVIEWDCGSVLAAAEHMVPGTLCKICFRAGCKGDCLANMNEVDNG